jgi:hypothetical protein
MFPTDLYMKALYQEKLREAEHTRRVAEARQVVSRTAGRERPTRGARSPLALDWLLRMILRAGAV